MNNLFPEKRSDNSSLQKKHFNLKDFKTNTIYSLNSVECFLTDFNNTLKYIKIFKFFK